VQVLQLPVQTLLQGLAAGKILLLLLLLLRLILRDLLVLLSLERVGAAAELLLLLPLFPLATQVLLPHLHLLLLLLLWC
jgi:hypothetical protein